MDDTAFVKFYGENDLSSPYYLELIEDKLSNDFVTADNKNINHIIELYNIKKYIDGGLYLKRWDNHRIIMYREICGKDIPAAIGRFMSQINDDNIKEEYSEVSINYTDDFWALFDKFKLYERISDAIFSELIRSKSTFLSEVLCFSRIVNSYGEDIRQFLIDDSKNAELLLQEFLSERDPGRKLFFPKEMSAEDKISLSWSYIMSSNPNLNYVRLIYKSNSTPDLPIDDKLKLEAKRVAEKLENELFSSDSGISYSITLVFSNVEEEMRLERNGLDTTLTYSKKWIHCNLDYPTILNNFIYLFQYVDKYCRCTFVSLPNDLGIFERIAGVRGKQEYLIGSSFTYVGKLTNMQMNAYRKCLEEKNISLEEVYKWFFEEYLDSEFGAKGFTYDIPSKGASYLEKCRALLISLDSVLKQYKLYCEYSNIDRELFELSSGHIVFDTIQSMTQDRYIYNSSDKIGSEMFLSYSDQSLMTHNKKVENRYKYLPDMLMHERLKIDDFESFQIPHIQFLIQQGLLSVNGSGFIEVDLVHAFILKELYTNGVLCYNRCSDKVQRMIKHLVQSGDLIFENRLFTRHESDYLNYMFNRSEFSNGLDLRNRYLHGTNSKDIRQQEYDYNDIMKITAFVIIKINEEFCLKYPIFHDEPQSVVEKV